MTPNRGTENLIDCESIEDYLRFPDPHKYMVGFICGIIPVRQTPKQASNVLSAVSAFRKQMPTAVP